MNNSLTINSRHKKVNSVQSLAKALNWDYENLQFLAKSLGNHHYREIKHSKSDGSVRVCYSPLEPLKTVQTQIQNTFFKTKFFFPSYITGSVRGCDFKTNAEQHLNAKILFSEDISSFFPSVSSAIVFNVWNKLFNFPKNVAQVLTDLTTRDGFLPQGSPTSSFIANCVFFNDEPTLVENFRKMGLVYTRYVDDVNISSRSHIKAEDKTIIIGLFYGMLIKNGFRPKRSKHSITTKNTKSKMRTTNVLVGFNVVKLPRESRNKIDKDVHVYSKKIFSSKQEQEKALKSLIGKVNHLGRFHLIEAQRLKLKLLSVSKL